MACFPPAKFVEDGPKIPVYFKNKEKDLVCKQLICESICALNDIETEDGTITAPESGAGIAKGFHVLFSDSIDHPGDNNPVDIKPYTIGGTGNFFSAEMCHNEGSELNLTTGVWTCPATGLYDINGYFEVNNTNATSGLAASIFVRIVTSLGNNNDYRLQNYLELSTVGAQLNGISIGGYIQAIKLVQGWTVILRFNAVNDDEVVLGGRCHFSIMPRTR